MRLKNRYVAAFLALPLAVALAACGDPSDDGGGGGGGNGGGNGGDEGNFTTSLQMGTGSVGGVYFPLGQEYANIFEDNIQVDGLKVSAVESGASVENLAKIGRGELQLGIAQHNTAVEAVAGEGEFDGVAIENAGFLGSMYPEAVQVITLDSTGIETVADLEGKRVAVGPPGGGTRAAAEQVLSAYGVEDYTAVEEGFSDAKAKLQDGNIDASIEVLGVPGSSLIELEATTGEAKLIPLDAEQITTITEGSEFEAYEISAEAYDFLEGPITTVSVFACMFGSTDQISPELGYEITKSIYGNAGDLTLPQKDLITLENALLGLGDLPLHPGAERYFEEEGLL